MGKVSGLKPHTHTALFKPNLSTPLGVIHVTNDHRSNRNIAMVLLLAKVSPAGPNVFPFEVYFFSSPFSLFFLTPLFPVGWQKFPGEKWQGSTMSPTPTCYTTVKMPLAQTGPTTKLIDILKQPNFLVPLAQRGPFGVKEQSPHRGHEGALLRQIKLKF